MSQSQKKPTKKKKPSGIKKTDKFNEKIKVPGTFVELISKAISYKK